MQDSIRNNEWETIDEIVVPVQNQELLLPKGMTFQKASAVSDSQPAKIVKKDSIAKAREDSIVRVINDSLAKEHSGYGIVLEAPYPQKEIVSSSAQVSTEMTGQGLSWIFAIMAALFFLVCMKFKNNPKYIKSLKSDIFDVRIRHNVFDNTVRKATFMIMLNLIWVCCAGVILWELVRLTAVDNPFGSYTIPDRQAEGIWICIGVSSLYLIFSYAAYWIVGNVFSDSNMTKLWMRGAWGTIGMQSLILFPLALLVLCHSGNATIMLIISALVFIFGKILYIFKGIKIFFNQISLWLLFLYYLCSLEIVPLILSYFAAVKICAEWL